MESELKFVREKRHGVAVEGSCLIDAAGRIGVFIAADCDRQGKCDSCAVTVVSGAEYLSEPTAPELEQLNEARRKKGERLACQAKITGSGAISVMTQEKKKEEKSAEEQRAEAFKKDFTALPLEKKIERLLELEMIAFGDTVSYVLNAPYTVGEKIVDIFAKYGFQKDEAERGAKSPKTEAASAADAGNSDSEPKKTKAKPRSRAPKQPESE